MDSLTKKKSSEEKEGSVYQSLLQEKENLLPFYLIFGDTEKNSKDIKNFFKEEKGVSVESNPDFIVRDFDIFKIEDAKKISQSQSKKNISSQSVQVFLLRIQDINIYTQNALLKTLEEPAENTYFFICLESDIKILPTLLSRARVIHANKGSVSDMCIDFMNGTFADREKIIKNIENTREKISLVGQIESYFLQNRKMYQKEHNWSSQDIYIWEKKLLELKKMSQTEGMNISNILYFIAIKFP